jgi:D-amino peptidase
LLISVSCGFGFSKCFKAFSVDVYPARALKAFVSVDLEGLPFVVVPGHLNLKGSLYEEARKIATRVALTAADELHNSGFEGVVVADSHGPMVNVFVGDLPDYVEVVRGYPRPLSMVSGVDGCDVALFVGYHAKFGTAKSTFDHTYSGGSICRVEVNGVAASEFLLNAYVAGELGVPVVLVAGEARLLADDVKEFVPWAERVVFKDSLGRYSARSSSMVTVEKELRAAVRRAVAVYRRGGARLLKAKRPLKVGVTFLGSHFADVAELCPSVSRVNGLSVEYAAQSMVDAYKTFELLVISASGISALLERLR